MRDLIPAMALLTSLVHVFTSPSVLVFFTSFTERNLIPRRATSSRLPYYLTDPKGPPEARSSVDRILRSSSAIPAAGR
jgi:hypothetical protein